MSPDDRNLLHDAQRKLARSIGELSSLMELAKDSGIVDHTDLRRIRNRLAKALNALDAATLPDVRGAA